jgi:D-sedoheptulose 7-phosphate isomerase
MKQVLAINKKLFNKQKNRGLKHIVRTDKTDHVSMVINETIHILQRIVSDNRLLEIVNEIAKEIVTVYEKGNKVLLCGNGGSAADAQHIAAELSGKFYFDRHPLSAEALHANTSYITAVANDYSFDEVFARLIKAQGHPGDVLIALSTSGNSKNIINALLEANRRDMVTVGLAGNIPNQMEKYCDYLFAVPEEVTPRIQECHIVIGHIICEIVENTLFAEQRPVVFLDRDGVINKKMAEGDYVKKWSEFSLSPDVCEAIKLLNKHNYLVIIVTNQQCVGKGIISTETLQSIHAKMIKIMEGRGARIDAVYVCPHTIQEQCSCRKPETGLFEQAIMDLRRRGISIDTKKSYMIGDSYSDILAGKRAGLKTVRVVENCDVKSGHDDMGLLEAIQTIINSKKRSRG